MFFCKVSLTILFKFRANFLVLHQVAVGILMTENSENVFGHANNYL